MNLANPNYYTTERAFQNYMHYMDEYMVSIAPIGGNWNSGPALTYNATTGYPNNIVNGNEAVMAMDMFDCEPVGTSFTITWTGPSNGVFVDGSTSTGTNQLTWVKSSAGRLLFFAVCDPTASVIWLSVGQRSH